MSKKKTPPLVRIHWTSPESDWHYFRLLGFEGEWLHLRGADNPITGTKHAGDAFWVHRTEVKSVSDVAT